MNACLHVQPALHFPWLQRESPRRGDGMRRRLPVTAAIAPDEAPRD